jgi:hypothetical protein
MSDEKILLTADEAISLLPEGEYVHNYMNPNSGMFLGCDFERENAEKHIREALQCEIGGPSCQRMKHGLVVWKNEKELSFFETDMDKLKAMEAARTGADVGGAKL